MKIEAREDVAAPKARVHAAVTDVARFEAALRGWGIEVARQDTGPLAPGAVWIARPEWQGRTFEVTATLMTLGEDGWSTEAHSAGLVAVILLDLVELAPDRTRMFIGVDIRATGMGSRLLLSSLRLAQGQIEKTFRERLARFAAGIA